MQLYVEDMAKKIPAECIMYTVIVLPWLCGEQGEGISMLLLEKLWELTLTAPGFGLFYPGIIRTEV